MKLKTVLAVGLVLLVVPVFGATLSGNAQLNGVYNFALEEINSKSTQQCTKIQVNGSFYNICLPVPVETERNTYGTIRFDGKGHATFLSIVGGGGSGSPVPGSVWSYSVSGSTGIIGSSTNGAAMQLGVRNAAGVAMVVLLRTNNGNGSTGLGVATLQ